MTELRQTGRVEISPTAIASIAGQAALASYGVVGLSAGSLRNGLGILLQREHYRRGVKVRLKDGQIFIDVYVIVQYGTRISEVGHNIRDSVRFSVGKALGIPVTQVNVHIQGLRLDDKD
jgi:uncharacterized alkaline shock family protein YloU